MEGKTMSWGEETNGREARDGKESPDARPDTCVWCLVTVDL